jgi:FkbM family methyltransferase
MSTLTEKITGRLRHLAHHSKHGLARYVIDNLGFAITPDLERVYTSPTTATQSWWDLTRGRYERDERAILTKHFTVSSTIIEVGSNIGVVSRCALTRLSPDGHLICVEPNPHAISALKKNIELSLSREWHYANLRVTVENAALCAPTDEVAGFQDFYARPDLSSGLVKQVKVRERESEIKTVPVTSLSSLLNKHGIDGFYSLIMDAEGAEIPLLYQDSAALRRCTQIAIELHGPSLTGQQITVEDMQRRLRVLGFEQQAQVGSNFHFVRKFV